MLLGVGRSPQSWSFGRFCCGIDGHLIIVARISAPLVAILTACVWRRSRLVLFVARQILALEVTVIIVDELGPRGGVLLAARVLALLVVIQGLAVVIPVALTSAIRATYIVGPALWC